MKIAPPTAHITTDLPTSSPTTNSTPATSRDSVFAGPTVLVKALYAYKGQGEDDTMSFVVGDDIQVSQATSLNKQVRFFGFIVFVYISFFVF